MVAGVATGPARRPVELRVEQIVLTEQEVRNSPMLAYVALLVQFIDGVTLGREAVIEWLLEAMRQHSMACRPPREYLLDFLHGHPP